MKLDILEVLCKSFAKFTGATVRLYHGNKNIYSYSVFPLDPDPFSLYEQEMLKDTHSAGIITTDLFQFYGFLHFNPDYSIVIGPTCILTEDKNGLNNLMLHLGIKNEARDEYQRKLLCAPTISAEQMSFCLSFFATAINQKPFSVENIYIKTIDEFSQNTVSEYNVKETFLTADNTNIRHTVDKSYSFEKIMTFYIKTGHPVPLRELLNSKPNLVKAGEMAKDTIRQLKNMGICSATVSSRAAIEGGLDCQTAFRLSDLYIQALEMLKDASSIYQLTNDMMLDFATRTMQTRYPGSGNSKLFQQCARYVSQNLYNNIKIETMAKDLGIARSYLCTQFHEKAGITLSRYILNEKIDETKRLLQFTDISISAIAMHLAFSSQSHFQTAFKKITGKTPLEFRLLNS